MASSSTSITGHGDHAILVVEHAISAEFADVAAADTTLSDSRPISPVTPPSEVNLDEVSPSTGPWAAALLAKASKLKLTYNDPTLKRSARQNDPKKGFRHNTCPDKHCYACDSAPPGISPSVIKNLGSNFCDIDPAELIDVALAKKKKALPPVGKKKAIKKHTKGNDEEDKDKPAAAKKKVRK
ncbi:hypothetical protein HU200_041221 [Digitaria exilis]|uniref:Uncharacterized protein n=1 Tax=Digitaria exilis TaxID=1010633 RepID=A0A835EEA5_9POAL|nr:hypothetical protein HU200_041221 [Digitaria exilis]